ncbi:hypothetical protein ES707_03854 [subsurface metagenome]
MNELELKARILELENKKLELENKKLELLIRKTEASKQMMRAFARPAIIFLFIGGAILFRIGGLQMVDEITTWDWLTFAMAGEWVLERPVIKMITRQV